MSIEKDDDDDDTKMTKLMWRRIATGAVAIAIFVGVVLGGAGIRSIAASAGAVDYCWIEVETTSAPRPTYVLRGHRPWRTDPRMGVFDTFELAQGAAVGIGCALSELK